MIWQGGAFCGEAAGIDSVFYRLWNGYRAFDSRERGDCDYCSALPALRLSFLLQINGYVVKEPHARFHIGHFF